jgi:hypothetical protein
MKQKNIWKSLKYCCINYSIPHSSNSSLSKINPNTPSAQVSLLLHVTSFYKMSYFIGIIPDPRFYGILQEYNNINSHSLHFREKDFGITFE